MENKSLENRFSVYKVANKNEVFINMENEEIKGDVLDVGFDNLSIIYNICKDKCEDLKIEYLKEINKGFYDTAIMFFSMNKLVGRGKKSVLKNIHRHLKKDGEILIWDVDKALLKTSVLKIKVLLPKGKIKSFYLKDLNILKNSSKEGTLKALTPYFDIVEFKTNYEIYYIKARKKELTNEIIISSN